MNLSAFLLPNTKQQHNRSTLFYFLELVTNYTYVIYSHWTPTTFQSTEIKTNLSTFKSFFIYFETAAKIRVTKSFTWIRLHFCYRNHNHLQHNPVSIFFVFEIANKIHAFYFKKLRLHSNLLKSKPGSDHSNLSVLF
jgi:hypothetical protein